MKVDAALTVNALSDVAAAARQLEAQGYDGIFTFEGPHDPFFPLLLAAEHTERVQLTTAVAIAFAAQPDDARADRVRPPARVAGTVPTRARHADQAAHREAVLDAVVAARRRACASSCSRIRAIWACWHEGTHARLPRRVLHAHVDDAVLQSGSEPVRLAEHLPRRRRPAHDRDGGRGRRRLHRPPVRAPSSSCARLTLPALERGLATAGRTLADIEIAFPVMAVVADDRRGARSRAATRCGRVSRSTARRPRTRSILDVHGWGDLQPELNRLSKTGRLGDDERR